MIYVTANIKKHTYELSMRGHAEYCPGNDIVCSACSALAGALIGWVYNNPGRVWGKADVTMPEDLHSGSGRAYLKACGGNSLRAAFMTAVIGLAQVAFSYPQNVRVEINGRLCGERPRTDADTGGNTLQKGEK